MKPPPEMQNLFYQSLGRLFYAIAAADKIVRAEEVNKLKHIVNTEWLSLSGAKSKADINAMRHIKITFNLLITQAADAYASLEEFRSFKRLNESLFTDDVKKQIWKTANVMASSFSGKNKTELVMLTKLAEILKEK